MAVDVTSGELSLDYEDASVIGTVALVWDRAYRTRLAVDAAVAPGPFGPGWTAEFLTTLTRTSTGFELEGPAGTVAFDLTDADAFARGARLRNLGAFAELFVRDGRLVVQKWTVATGNVYRYLFDAAAIGVPAPMVAIEDVTGVGVDIAWSGGRPVRMRQRLEGRALEPSYDARGRVERVVVRARDGSSSVLARYEYDATGRLSAVFDAADLADRYEYDDRGRLVREIARDGGVFTFRYDGLDRCVRTSGADRYDEKTLRFTPQVGFSEVTDSLGATIGYRFNADGQILEEIDARGARRAWSFDPFGRVLAEIDANGHVRRYEYDDRGDRVAVIDALGRETRDAFNDDHLVVERRDPAGGVWRRRYDASNRLVESVDPAGGRWQVSWDADGRSHRLTDPEGVVSRREFDAGELVRMVDGRGAAHLIRYDALGRVMEVIDPLQRRLRIEHDLRGDPVRIERPDGNRVTIGYDAGGNLTSYVDETGRTFRYRYGPCHRLLQTIDPDGGTVRYEWSTEPDRLLALVDEKGERYALEWTATGRLQAVRSPDGVTTRFERDAAGRHVRTVTGDGATVELRRDAAGQLVERLLPDGDLHRYAYDPNGHLASAITRDHTVELERDALSRVVFERQDERWIRRRFGARGNLMRLESSDGAAFGFEHDGEDALTSVDLGPLGRIAIGRDALGREVERRLPLGHAVRQGWNVAGRLASQTLVDVPGPGSAGAPREERLREIAYDPRGVIARLVDRQGITTFEHDGIGRLVAAQRDDGAGERYRRDATGNVVALERTAAGGAAAAIERLIGAGNRLERSGDTVFMHDDAGRRTRATRVEADGTESVSMYRWDAAGRLTAFGDAAGREWRYTYDGFGRRCAKHGPSGVTRFVWDGDVLLHEIVEDAEGARVTTWVHEPLTFRPLVQVRGGQAATIVTDETGAPTELLGMDGRLRQVAPATPWGARPDVAACPLGRAGQYHDSESGLLYSRFRYLDPETQRFLSPDPAGIVGGLNLYAYCPNPLQDVDPYGLDSRKLDQALGGTPHDGQQAHHIIPEAVMNDHPGMMAAAEQHGWQRDGKQNGIHLPSDDAAARAANGGKGIPSHRGSHPQYNAMVGADVQKVADKFNAGLIDGKQAAKELKKISNKYRKMIKNNDPSLPRGQTSNDGKTPCKLG